jgi:hypothetical protein
VVLVEKAWPLSFVRQRMDSLEDGRIRPDGGLRWQIVTGSSLLSMESTAQFMEYR